MNHYVTTAVQTNVMEGKQTKTPQQIVLRKEKRLKTWRLSNESPQHTIQKVTQYLLS